MCVCVCVLFAVCSASLLCPLLRAVRCAVCVCCVPPGPGSPQPPQKQRNSKQTTRISHSRDKQHQRISTGKRRVLVQRIQTAEASESHAHALRNLSRCVLCAVQCCCAMPCTMCCALCCCAVLLRCAAALCWGRCAGAAALSRCAGAGRRWPPTPQLLSTHVGLLVRIMRVPRA